LFTVCFVHYTDIVIAQTQMFGVHYMPVWIYTLAAHVRPLPDVTIKMFDNRIHNDNELPKADLYLFTGINQDHKAIFTYLEKARKMHPHAKFILGGPICWSYQQAGRVEQLYAFDHLVVGDGEPVIVDLISKVKNNQELPKILAWNKKFEVAQSVIMDRTLLDETIHNYYGAVVEVSRGCPFLCEFCDIRIQKDNNKPHNHSPEKIVSEIDYFARKGVNQILFACDNFLGDPLWTESVCDAIIEWREKTGLRVNIYTWLTINLANYPKIMEKLHKAGFDMFFIGIESFDSNQLLETAKIQNVKAGLTDSIRKIQSYGFIVVAGLIFGFDTESDEVCHTTLDGILASGLISGEPSLLTALPGTPLYKRMKFSNRLRDGKLGLGGYKYQTNIKYLRSTAKVISNFMTFVKIYNGGSYQYTRFKNFTDLIQPEYFPSKDSTGYINVTSLFKLAAKNKKSIWMLVHRLAKLLSSPVRLFYFLRGMMLAFRLQLQGKSVWKYFNFWFFVWSNSVIKFEALKPEHFDIGAVEDNFDMKTLLPTEYLNTLDEPIPEHKIKAQRKFTTEALEKLVNARAK
jgi:radical SAM superfamily enzyme YgiQ (UPF0313 family)